MHFFELLKIEFLKVKRSKILPLLFVAPLLVVVSGVASLHRYFTPEYINAWAAMFIQSALLYSYYLLPLSMIVICVMLAGREAENNGMLKMLALPISRHSLSAAKFCVLVSYLLMEIIVFLIVFVIAGLFAAASSGIIEPLPVLYVLKWCCALFFTMIPSLTIMWAITVLSDKAFVTIGLNILLVLPSILMANTPLWFAYPYCYSGYLVTCSLHAFTTTGIHNSFSLVPFLPCAVLLFLFVFWISITSFGKKEMR